MRARIDISEIEAETKIRAKYLRALENEEWDLLPGPTYVKSFLRTYADALGLDGKLLIEEYKLRHERLSDVELQPIAPPGQRERRRRPRAAVPRGWLVADRRPRAARGAVGDRQPQPGRRRRAEQHAAGLDALDDAPPRPARRRRPRRRRRRRRPRPSRSSRALQIVATGQVYVCLKAAGKRTPVPGIVLTGGARQGPYKSSRFRLQLGTSEARLIVNGKSRTRPAGGQRHRLRDHAHQGAPPAGGAVAALPDRVSAHAGIVVTGTEVLTGRVTDRNGPWLSERLRELGVDHAYTLVVGDRREDMEQALRFLAARGRRPDRDERRAGADRRRPDGRGRRARSPGARWSSTSRSRSASPRSCVRCCRAGPTSIPTRSAPPTASRRSSRTAPTILEPVGTAPGLVVPRSTAARRSSCSRGRRASCTRCGRPRCRPRPSARPPPGRSSCARRCCACSGSPSRRSPRRCAWPRTPMGSRASRSPPACAAARSRSSRASRPRPRRLRALRGDRPRAPRRHAVLRRRPHRRPAGGRPAAHARAHDRHGGVVHGRAAGRAADRPRRLVGLRAGRARRLLQRGEGRRWRASIRRSSSAWARCRSRSPRRWPTARGRRWTRTSAWASRAWPGLGAGRPRSRSGLVWFSVAGRDGARLTRSVNLPGRSGRHPRSLDHRRHAPRAAPARRRPVTARHCSTMATVTSAPEPSR